jgi:hypothetical protein
VKSRVDALSISLAPMPTFSSAAAGRRPPPRAAARPLATLVVLISLVGAAACRQGIFKQYEYEEDIHLALDGSATVYVNASIAALAALRGFDLDCRPTARLPRTAIRAAYAGSGVEVEYLSAWRREGRRFVSVRLGVDDIRQLSSVAPLAWSKYDLRQEGDEYVYRQAMGPSAGRKLTDAGWIGGEEIAIRLHLPSKITSHNAGEANFRRGNILVWEQSMADRLAGVPLVCEARMEPVSILYRTLWLFAGSALAAIVVMAAVLWWVVKRKS